MHPGNPWASSEQAKISRQELKGKHVTAPKRAPGDRGKQAAAEGLGSLGPVGGQLGGLGGGGDPRPLHRLGKGRQHPQQGSEDRLLTLRPLRGLLGVKTLLHGTARGIGVLSEAPGGEEPCVLSDGVAGSPGLCVLSGLTRQAVGQGARAPMCPDVAPEAGTGRQGPSGQASLPRSLCRPCDPGASRPPAEQSGRLDSSIPPSCLAVGPCHVGGTGREH